MSRLTQTTYDPAGNATAVTDIRGNNTTYAYDSMNRLTLTTYPAWRDMEQTKLSMVTTMLALQMDGRDLATTCVCC